MNNRLKDYLSKLQSFNTNLNLGLIEQAYDLANDLHKNQKRESGEDYITHPIAVSLILASYNLDTETIISALLHDAIEDTDLTISTLQSKFGKNVCKLVTGITKLTTLTTLTKKNTLNKDFTNVDYENLKNFILAISSDIRVLFIKLADRLHNMQTIEYIKSYEKKKRIAQETLDIYIPLADRMGLTIIKEELEDLCFATILGDVRTSILNQTSILIQNSKDEIQNISNNLKNLINQKISGIHIYGRVKRPYSIWKKLQQKDNKINKIYDIFAFRIIVSKEEDCYTVLQTIHKNFKSIFSRFKDYISSPKLNGYQSLHTGIFIDDSTIIEIQIRTHDMHQFAERGIASHWLYKEKNYQINLKDIKEYNWLQNIVKIIKDTNISNEQKYKYTRMELFSDQIFVFTPKGMLIRLPINSTVLDFAYRVHTDLGRHCLKAEIDRQEKDIFTILKNGQIIKIITSNDVTPKEEWLYHVKTGYAITQINRYLKQNQSILAQSKVNNLIKDICLKNNLVYSSSFIKDYIKHKKITSKSFYEKILSKEIAIIDIINYIYPDFKFIINHTQKEDLVLIGGYNTDSINLIISPCCNPIYGDEIRAILVLGKTIEVHRSNCITLTDNSINKIKEVNMLWSLNSKKNKFYISKLKISILNIIGSLSTIVNIFQKYSINIMNVNITENKESICNIIITFEITSLERLLFFINKIEECYVTKKVERI
jgi:guanosine-3',5'-bis(diphosphate) 3'-pyrophosphohydrolase